MFLQLELGRHASCFRSPQAMYELLSSEETYNKSLAVLVDLFAADFQVTDDGKFIWNGWDTLQIRRESVVWL